MSKTFKTITTTGRTLKVCGVKGTSVYLEISSESESRRNINLDASDVPALALAVLEAVFGDDQPAPNKIGEAWAALYVHIAEQERATAEAKGQAELEAEALELYRAAYDARGLASVSEFRLLSEKQKTEWLAVARKAREMRNKKKESTDD